MKSTVEKLMALLTIGEHYFKHTDETELLHPIAPGKWSKKEILGHLIDSAINNLIRFTEIGYQPQPYLYREYNQKELVEINRYQSMPIDELLQMWLSLNRQIVRVILAQTDERLSLKVFFPNATVSDLRFIIKDYPNHLEHHINQITQQ